MARDSREWSVPAPVRALLWWPGTAFLLAIAFPAAAVGLIVAAGAVLAGLGWLAALAGRRRERAASALDPPTQEFPAIEVAPTREQAA